MLIEELSSASGNLSVEAAAAAAAELAAEEDGEASDDGDWEDEPNTLDLSLASIKNQLMSGGGSGGSGLGGLGDAATASFGDGTNSILSTRQRDDETQAYLMDFFRDVSARNVGGFRDLYAALTEEEQRKLSVVG